ncbi:MAG TPA: glycosyltransferase [Acidobacteriaceae bacterium]|nr:glycosyltransferase [Acidobacteriaceae bacterium]
MPELSVCIPTYNYGRFLPKTIESVMRQGLHDFEIVISDNASQDGTEAVVKALDNKHIRYFRNEINLGPHENSRRCLAYAQGKYIKFLCADDVLLDGVLLKQLEILRHRPGVALVTCDLLITDSELHVERTLRFFPGSCSGSRVINACLSGLINYVGGPSNIMFRRANSAGLPFDDTYHGLADLKLNLHLLHCGDYVNIDEAGYLYRRHPNSDSEISVTRQISRAEPLRLIEEYNWWNPLSCLKVMRLHRAEGWHQVRKHWRQACMPIQLLKAFTAAPDVLRMYIRNTYDFRNPTHRKQQTRTPVAS